ncbi:MAG: response regulator [bacterium]|nr:response regulator [bacterium]
MGQEMLEQLGYDVTPMSNSVEAPELFRNDPGSFHLVISDLTMPEMSGFHLAMEMMKIKAGIQVIICTGYSRQLDRRELEDLGVKELILKPYDKKQLATVVRKVLDEN